MEIKVTPPHWTNPVGKTPVYDAELEYIECLPKDATLSSGFYINTGIIPRATNTSFEIRVKPYTAGDEKYIGGGLGRALGVDETTKAENTRLVFGASFIPNGWTIIHVCGTNHNCFYFTETHPESAPPLTFSWNAETLTAKGIRHDTNAISKKTFETVNQATFEVPMTILGQPISYKGKPNWKQIYSLRGLFYYCKIWQDGELLVDLIPVKKWNQPNFYNKVTKKLMKVMGNGEMVCGPEKV